MDLTDDLTETVSRPERESIGAFLKARRVALGLTHADVGNAVKLSARRIQALEEERWGELPDGPFLRGFLRNVARALDLDAASLTERVDESLMQARRPEIILAPPSPPHGIMPRRRGPMDDRHGGRNLVVGAFVFAALAALIAWSGTDSFAHAMARARALAQPSPVASAPAAPSASASTSAPEPVAAAQREPAVDEPSDAAAGSAVPPAATATTGPVVAPSAVGADVPAAPTAQTAVANGPSATLAFHFDEECWVEVRSADGRVLLTGINPPASDQQVDGPPPLSIVVGNARGVSLRLRGQPVDLVPYTRDNVARFTLP